MFRLFLLIFLALAVPLTASEWRLADHFDSLFVYDGREYREFEYTAKDIRGPHGGRVMWSVYPKPDGGLRPFGKGMEVRGELQEGQMLLSGSSMYQPAVVEFVLEEATQLAFDYGLCDYAREKNNTGTRIVIEMIANGESHQDVLTITENRWATNTFPVPQAERVLVRLTVYRRGNESFNWTATVLRGDGRIGTREEARALSPNRDRIGEVPPTLKPSPHRVTAREGYDILFYRDRPFWSYAVKGFPRGAHELQKMLGVNTYYVEGMTFVPYWPMGADGVTVPNVSAICDDLRLCQPYDMPFKCTMSLAHCSPFLPSWLVAQESLGIEGHQLRKGGPTHTSFIKPKTMQYHKQGVKGWVQPFLDQPTIFVFGQEDDGTYWDDYSAEAVASWRAWLRRQFKDDFAAFSRYVGGVKDISGFDDVPQPERYKPDPRVGYPMRLGYLKILWITESYGDYQAELCDFVRQQAPDVPITQRYVNWAYGGYISRRVKADYSYTFGHLSTEGVPNSYGFGKKYWTGVYAHFGTLPLPRGGSIGKAYSREIRRGEMNEREWRVNAFTLLANGCSGTEYSTLVPTWGEAWWPAALLDRDFKPTPTGLAGKKVMAEVLELSKYMLHFEHEPDVAVFHDGAFHNPFFSGRWGQSKVGAYTLIRESGFHYDPLTYWDITAEKLAGRKVLVLAGSLSIAPEVQAAIREYVRGGGALVTLFCSDGQGFPGCNSYAFACNPRQSATERSFESPAAAAHLGDVMGIQTGGGVASRQTVRTDAHGAVSLSPFNTLADEGRWVAQQACAAQFAPAPGARVIASFEDGSPAAIENRFGEGRAITFAVDLGLIANNITVPAFYRWWSDLLESIGCRKPVDTGNCFVEAGAWHDDDGNRLTIFVNHDDDHPQTAMLADGTQVPLGSGECKTMVRKWDKR